MKIVIFPNPDGVISVLTPMLDCGLTLEEICAKDIPTGVPYLVIDSSDLPENPEFAGAWTVPNIDKGGSVITINLDRAKEIKKESLRRQRKPLLEAQDVAFQRALESNSDTTSIVAEKQRLRDITLLVDTATSVEDLKAISIEQN